MRTLVTGASGFVGACAVRELMRRGHDVHVLVREPARAWRLAELIDSSVGRVSRPVSLQQVGARVIQVDEQDGSGDPSYEGSGLTIHAGDLLDASSVRREFAAATPEIVLHLATHGAYESQADARTILDTSIVGTLHLLEAAADAKVRLFVQTGSSSEYGFREEPMAETDRLEPNSVYAVAKSAQTHLGRLWTQRSAMPVVTLRLFSVYGPWEEPSRLIPTLLDRARRDLPLLMVSPDTVRDFVYVDDVVDALLDFDGLSALGGEILNLGTGVETTMNALVETTLDLLGSRSEVRWNAYPARTWDTNRWCADPRKAFDRLGWSPRHSLRDGLAKTIAWLDSPLAPRLCGGRGAGGEGGTANPPKPPAFAKDTVPPHPDPLPPQSRGARGRQLPFPQPTSSPAGTSPAARQAIASPPEDAHVRPAG